MKLTVVNGTNRIDNKSIEIAKKVVEKGQSFELEASLVTLEHFDKLFRGDYIDFENATPEQKSDLESIKSADILMFVIPVYHQGIPSSLKNFFDSVSIKDMYSNNAIGMISANSRSREGARQAAQVLNGYMAFVKSDYAYIVPEIPMINPSEIDEERIGDFINKLLLYAKKHM